MVARKMENSGTIPNFDDGWWASILSDEERFVSPPPRPRPALSTPPPPVREQTHVLTPVVETVRELPAVDFDTARRIYQHDEIVDLAVTGYNRGGLLVEGDDLQGFVPFSHLVEMVSHPEGDGREEFLSTFVGRSLKLKIIECVPEEGRVVFSERAARSESGCPVL